MKITKYGHCCLLIEEKGLRILTDPGNYTTAQSEVKKIDAILITHEHIDHLHIPSLKDCLKNNPKARIITNKGVAKMLDAEGIKYELVEDGQNVKIKDVLIEGFGKFHAEMHKTLPLSGNTGYFISNRLFYPGDALYNPKKSVEILALPVAGPWIKISEAIDYALEIKPKIAFPVHDAGLKSFGSAHFMPQRILTQKGINFMAMEEGKEANL